MSMMGWLSLVTIPTGILAFVIYLAMVIIASQSKKPPVTASAKTDE